MCLLLVAKSMQHRIIKVESDAGSMDDGYSTQEEMDNRLEDLRRENTALEKVCAIIVPFSFCGW